MNPTQLPTDGTLPLLVLQIIAVSGEFPPAFSGHFPGGSSYIESVIGKLKKDGLLRSYTKNGLRGLRLTANGCCFKNIHLTLRPILQARPKQTL